ncbi:MAG: RHS repeat-associated core domain-containing protein, partial [Thermodesulfobacteriota bacterium]
GKIDSGELTWTFDPAGNRVEERIGGRVIHATFGAANELLTRGGIRFGYDDRGNQTEKIFPSGRKHAFAYSAANRLVSFSTGHEKKWRSKLKTVERYVYDTDNQRVAVEEVNGKKVTWFHWEGSRPIEEWQEIGKGHGKKEKGVLYFRDLGGQLLDQVRYWRKHGRSAPDPERCEDDPDDEDDDTGPLAGHLHYLRWIYPDHLGSTSLIANAHGRRLDRLQYGPWGEKLGGGHTRTRFGYTGHQNEARSGYWYSVWRYLDPRAGRWTQRDPIGNVGAQHLYSYAFNQPLHLTDPLGLKVFVRSAGGSVDTFVRWWQSIILGKITKLSHPNGWTELKLCDPPIESGIAFQTFDDAVSSGQQIRITLVENTSTWVDAFVGIGQQNIDIGDLDALGDAGLDPSGVYHCNAMRRRDALVHAMAEQLYAVTRGAPYDPSHAHALSTEAAFRQERGAAARSIWPLRPPGPTPFPDLYEQWKFGGTIQTVAKTPRLTIMSIVESPR